MPRVSLTWNSMSQRPKNVMLRRNSSDEESSISQALRIVVGLESGVLKRLQHLCRREQAELMDLAGASRAHPVRDLVIKEEAREPSLDFETTHASDADSIRFPGVARDTFGI